MYRLDLHMQQFDRAYFIGVGGIGMSALARYFRLKGWSVAGYDKTRSPLTEILESEGVEVHYEDLGEKIPETYSDKENTLVIYTPAVPSSLGELNYFRSNDFHVLKRAEVLGVITRNSKAIGVAGTHGKTTTSTILAHMLNESELGCNAFLGGIATNFNSNFVHHDTSSLTVVEADEFDRSFLQLNPYASILTSTDADHLDIYGDTEEFLSGFSSYVELIDEAGFLVRHVDVELSTNDTITYGVNKDADYSGMNLRLEAGRFLFDLNRPNGSWKDVELGVPGTHNVENAIACVVVCERLGLAESTIRASLKSFRGVKRRFEYHIRTPELVYIDDYAHHPTEINALVDSIRLIYPNKKAIGIFQPHLFSRTRDFFDGFVQSLERLDEVILLPIYPAREEPIDGVTSDAILEKMTHNNACLLQPNEVVAHISELQEGVVLTIGAGDIDRIVPQIKNVLSE